MQHEMGSPRVLIADDLPACSVTQLIHMVLDYMAVTTQLLKTGGGFCSFLLMGNRDY
jgi:hypothetical protein